MRPSLWWNQFAAPLNRSPPFLVTTLKTAPVALPNSAGAPIPMISTSSMASTLGDHQEDPVSGALASMPSTFQEFDWTFDPKAIVALPLPPLFIWVMPGATWM